MAMHPIDGAKGDALGSWTADDAAGEGSSSGSPSADRGSLADYALSVVADDAATLRYYTGLAAPFSVDQAKSPAGDSGATTFGTGLPAPSATLVEDFGNALPGFHGQPSIDSLAKGSSRPGGGGHGGGGGGGFPQTVKYTTVGSSLVFNITYDSSVGSASPSFVTAFASAVNYFESTFSNTSATINLNVGWGEVAGQRLPFGALGESSTNIFLASYDQLAHPTTPTPLSALLPATDPIGGTHSYWVASAEEKALGLGGTSSDGAVGFSSSVTWNFSGGASAGVYDFVAVAEHEISETMGRIALLGATITDGVNTYLGGYTPYDLFRYSSYDTASGVGTRSLVGGQTAYFSPDGGNTNLRSFNTTFGGDYGDWASTSTKDAYDAYASSGTDYAGPGSVDQTVMNVLGFKA